MSFQMRKSFVHLQNTNLDILLRYFDEIWELSDPADIHGTTTFKAQKCTKDIIKIVHMTFIILQCYNNTFLCPSKTKLMTL